MVIMLERPLGLYTKLIHGTLSEKMKGPKSSNDALSTFLISFSLLNHFNKSFSYCSQTLTYCMIIDLRRKNSLFFLTFQRIFKRQ
jgi:hypothetical protein